MGSSLRCSCQLSNAGPGESPGANNPCIKLTKLPIQTHMDLLRAGDIYRTKFTLRQEPGKVRVPEGWAYILIPTVEPNEPMLVTVRSGNCQEEQVTWGVENGFLLQGNTTLSTESPIYLISISLPIFDIPEI